MDAFFITCGIIYVTGLVLLGIAIKAEVNETGIRLTRSIKFKYLLSVIFWPIVGLFLLIWIFMDGILGTKKNKLA